MKATIQRIEPKAADYIYMHIEGGDGKSDAEGFCTEIEGFENAVVHWCEEVEGEEGCFEVTIKGDINTSNFYVGQTFED